MKKLSVRVMRALVASLFVLIVFLGFALHGGLGTFSSFGPGDLAAVCPLGSLEVLFAQKTWIPHVVVSLVVFATVCWLLGRVFCGWVCPVPWLDRFVHFFGKRKDPAPFVAQRGTRPVVCSPAAAAGEVKKKKMIPIAPVGQAGKKAGTSRLPYWILGGTLLSSAVCGFPVFCLICPVGLTFAVVVGFWRLFAFSEVGMLLVFLGFVLLELIVLRRWCHLFCPLGALMTLMSKMNRFWHPRVDPQRCLRSRVGVPCDRCEVACPEGLAPYDPAVGEASRCTKCGLCREACPADAVRFGFLSGNSAAVEVTQGGAAAEAEQEAAQPGYGKILSTEQLIAEANRCLKCGMCSRACPQGNPVNEWMKLVANGRIEEAARMVVAAGALPAVCGQLCPQNALCEGACSASKLHRAVAIGAVERTLAHIAGERGIAPDELRAPGRRRVAVIGAGPAGLSCAERLAHLGVPVTVFEKERTAGGLLTHGIPFFKFDGTLPATLQHSALLKIEPGHSVDGDEFSRILSEFDAVFVATGAPIPVKAGIAGETAAGCISAIDFLRPNAAADACKGKTVVVLGGGDTAVDCARLALRQGAGSASMVARKPVGSLRANPEQLELLRQEGGVLLGQTRVEEILADEAGAVRGVLCATNEGHRQLEADIVVVAYGFVPERAEYLERAGVAFDAAGRIVTDANAYPMQTTADKIFAGGDVVRGASLVVNAVRDGRNAASSIARALGLIVVAKA